MGGLHCHFPPIPGGVVGDVIKSTPKICSVPPWVWRVAAPTPNAPKGREGSLKQAPRRSVAGSPTREQAARKGGFNRGLVLPPIVFLSFFIFFFVFKP